MRPFVVLGLCLVAAALFVLARGGSFSARKDVIHVGDVTVSADVVALVGGVAMVATGVRRRAE